MKSTRILIGITVGFLVPMTYITIMMWYSLSDYWSYTNFVWGLIFTSLDVAGFVALSLLLRKRKREKIEKEVPIQSGSMPAGGQLKDEEPSRPHTKEKEPDYSLDDSKLK